MIELQHFIKLLLRNRITLIAVPLVTLVLCFFLVRELPDEFKSHGSIATGLVDKTERILSVGESDQESEINRKFDNLIQMMTLKVVIDQVSYKLLLHDLKATEATSFRKPGKILSNLGKADREKLIAVLSKKLATREELAAGTKDNDLLIKILKEQDFDYTSVVESVSIYRLKSSDYISIDSEADSPELAQFLISTVSNEFIAYYGYRVTNSNKLAIEFLAGFLDQKRGALSEKMDGLRNYKVHNRVLNLYEQAKSLYGQIADYETKKEMAQKDIIAYNAAITNIDKKFNPADRKYLETALSDINQQIVSTKVQLRALNDAYVKSNFDQAFKLRVDSLQNKLAHQISESSDRYIYSPMAAKGDLITEKLKLEIELELAANSVSSIDGELVRLNRKFDALVPNEAHIQEFETGIDIASKEYIEALQKYNSLALEANFPLKLRQAEQPMPGTIQPSKKLVLLILSGVISFVFCLLVFFILFYFDRSVRDPQQLANQTDLPVIGYLSQVSGAMDLEKIQSDTNEGKSMGLFRNLVRSIRYELDADFPGPKIIVVTSLQEGEGKTLLTMSLAWAFSRISKKVMIIDGNFDYPQISKLNRGSVLLEKALSGNQVDVSVKSSKIGVLGNAGGDTSLNEIASEANIASFLKNLKAEYDVVLVEADALSSMNKAKEWISYADLVVSVFANGASVKQEDKSKIDYLNSLGSRFSGWVLTGAKNITERTGKTFKTVSE